MSEKLVFRYDVAGNDFTSAGQASVLVKKNLRQLGLDTDIIRRVSIAMYEGEINMVIHAGGGIAEVCVTEDYIDIILEGPGSRYQRYRTSNASRLLYCTGQHQDIGFRRRYGSSEYEKKHRFHGYFVKGRRRHAHSYASKSVR